MTTALQIRLNKSYNLFEMRLVKSHNLIVPKSDLGIGSSVKPTHKLAKSLTKISSKIYKLKTYNEAIDNLIYKNKWYEIIDKELWSLDLYQI